MTSSPTERQVNRRHSSMLAWLPNHCSFILIAFSWSCRNEHQSRMSVKQKSTVDGGQRCLWTFLQLLQRRTETISSGSRRLGQKLEEHYLVNTNQLGPNAIDRKKLKYKLNYSNGIPSTANGRRISSNVVWPTISNAALWSSTTSAVTSPQPIARMMLFITLIVSFLNHTILTVIHQNHPRTHGIAVLQHNTNCCYPWYWEPERITLIVLLRCVQCICWT